MKFNKAINSFGSGELGPELRARFDTPQYKQGAQTIDNFTVDKTGGLSRRFGTELSYSIDHQQAGAYVAFPEKLIPYAYKNQEFLVAIPTGALAAVDTIKWYKENDLEVVEQFSVVKDFTPNYDVYYEEVHHIQYTQVGKYLVIVSTEGKVAPFVFYYNDSLDATGTPTDTMYCQHWDEFTKDKPLGFGWLAANNDESILMTPKTATTAAERGVAGVVAGELIEESIRDNDTYITCNVPFFTLDHEGMFIRIVQVLAGSNYVEGIARIQTIVSTTEVSCVEWVAFSGVGVPSEKGDWALSAFGSNPNRGELQKPYWPRSVGAFQERLIFGSSVLATNSIFIGRLGSPKIFMDLKLYQDRIEPYDPLDPEGPSKLGYYAAVQATDAFSMSLVSTEAINVSFIVGSNILFVGTLSRPFIIRPTSESFGPLSSEAISQKALSCGRVQPASTPEGIAFVSEDFRNVNLGLYNESTGEYVNKNITLLNNTIATVYSKCNIGGSIGTQRERWISQLVWDRDNSRLIALNNLGCVSSLTLEEGAATAGWSKWKIADGYRSYVSESAVPLGNNQEAFVGSIARIQHSTFMYTSRAGALLYTSAKAIEQVRNINPNLLFNSNIQFVVPRYLDMYHITPAILDAGTVYTLPDHFANLREVAFMRYSSHVSGIPQLDVGIMQMEPSGTSVPIDVKGKYMFGIDYSSLVIGLPMETGDTNNASAGSITRVDRVDILVHDAAYCKVITNYNEDIALDLRGEDSITDKDVVVHVPHSPEVEATVGVKVDLPLPCTVLGLVLRGVSNE